MAELAFTELKNRSTIRPSRAAVWMASFLAALTAAWTAWACPSCPPARAARQQVWDDGIATNLVIALVPFLLVAMVSVWAERIGRRAERVDNTT
jgi:hypothetical protein